HRSFRGDPLDRFGDLPVECRGFGNGFEVEAGASIKAAVAVGALVKPEGWCRVEKLAGEDRAAPGSKDADGAEGGERVVGSPEPPGAAVRAHEQPPQTNDQPG